jgi:zinc transport system permease protein
MDTLIDTVAGSLGLPTFLFSAFIAGTLVSLLAGYFGAFVVQRGMGFLGNGLAHAAFGGVALGVYLNVDPLLTAIPFTLVVALGIVWLKEHTRLAPDTVIGVLFSLSMAIGVILLAKTPRYATDAFNYLFGSILYVGPLDLYAAAGAVLLASATIPIWGRWAYATFDREMALADRIPCLRDDYLLSACLAATIVVAMKLVGIVLVGAFLVIPPAIARLLSRTFIGMTILSVVLGAASVVVGLALSWHLDLPAGASIIVVQCAGFGITLLFRRNR